MKNIAMMVCCESKPKNENISNEESLIEIVNAGFDKVFMSFQNEHLNENFNKYFKLCKENKLEIIFVHLGYRVNSGIATIWEEGTEGETLVNDYKKDLEILAKHNIKMAVMHVTKSSKQSEMSEIGLKRWQELTKHAEKLGIVIALENTRWPGYLEFILDNIESPNLQICYDSGHDHTHFKDTFDFEKFKNRIACVHLHDNDQTSDQHLLPFDGTINWDNLVRELKEAGFNGVMTCESVYQGKYTQKLKPQEFFKQAHEILEKLDSMMNNKKII